MLGVTGALRTFIGVLLFVASHRMVTKYLTVTVPVPARHVDSLVAQHVAIELTEQENGTIPHNPPGVLKASVTNFHYLGEGCTINLQAVDAQGVITGNVIV